MSAPKSNKQTKSLELLNAARGFIVEKATEQGIFLQNEFESQEKFQMFVIAVTMKQLVELGLTVEEALDAVLGDGAYDRLVNEVWETLQKQQQNPVTA